MIPELPGAVPEIPVSDVVAAAAYYRDKLSFSVDWLDADIALAGLSRDQCRLFLAGPAFREACGNASPVVTWLNLTSKGEVDDCTALGAQPKPFCCPTPNRSPGACTNSRQRIRTGTDSACSMTSRRQSANARGPWNASITAPGVNVSVNLTGDLRTAAYARNSCHRPQVNSGVGWQDASCAHEDPPLAAARRAVGRALNLRLSMLPSVECEAPVVSGRCMRAHSTPP
jgi:hypothetical protein